MTEAEWKEVDVAFEELCNVYLPKEYLFEFRQFTRVVDRFIQDSKPFEVEVGKEYIPIFEMTLWQANDSYLPYAISEEEVIKKITYKIYKIKDRVVYIEYDKNNRTALGLDQFKACFKPLENDKN